MYYKKDIEIYRREIFLLFLCCCWFLCGLYLLVLSIYLFFQFFMNIYSKRVNYKE